MKIDYLNLEMSFIKRQATTSRAGNNLTKFNNMTIFLFDYYHSSMVKLKGNEYKENNLC